MSALRQKQPLVETMIQYAGAHLNRAIIGAPGLLLIAFFVPNRADFFADSMAQIG